MVPEKYFYNNRGIKIMRLINSFFLVFFIFISANIEYIGACTIVTVSNGKIILAGNNEDWQNPNTKVWFFPSNDKEYGRICWGFDKAFDFAEGGMNDQGLFIDANALDETGWKADPKKPNVPDSTVDFILSHCATVEEVLDLFRKYNVNLLAGGKFPVADAKGDAAVIEWGQGKLQFLKRDGRYQISTNFVQSNYKPNDYPCNRYKIADKILSSSEEVSIDLVRSILSATANEFFYPTLYSNICDLKHKKIYLYNFHNFEEVCVIDLTEELKQGKHAFDIPSLFRVKTQAALLFDKYRIKSGKEELMKIINDKGIEDAIEQFYKFKEDQFRKIRKIDIRQGEINDLGYLLLKEGRLKEAIVIFKLNVSEHPDLWNAYHSLGEAYFKNGDIELAVENYKRSLELNPQNINAREMLKRIGKEH
jgi:tetratricopeptide (TPR) repeat protein